MPSISIILPFHNEAASMRALFARLYPVLGSLSLDYEIICIDDGSTDNTYQALKHERDKDRRVRLVRMARNFGKEAALACGLKLASGNAAVTMDSDLQHPPETIRELVQKWNEGYELVYAVRRNRKSDNIIYRMFARAFYAVFRTIAEVKLPEGAGDFCLLGRIVIDAVNNLPERNRFTKGLVSWVGFRQTTVPFDVEARTSGTTHWNFFRLMRFAFDGISAFSTLPLRIWTWSGAVVSFAALGYGIYLTLSTLINGVDVPGFASLMVGILFLGGLQLLSLGMIGEYLARIFTEVKARPLYFIAEHDGFDTSGNAKH
jgi:glycosyltransferase involved in cell wall biosynthesis